MAAAAPRKRQVDERKSASADGQSDGEALGEIARVEAIGALCHLPLLEEDIRADRSPERMLDALLKSNQVRSAEPVVVVGRQQPLAVEIGSAERRLKIERHDIAVARGRTRREDAETDRAFAIARVRNG